MRSVRKILRDDQRQKLAPLLPGKAGDKGRSGQDNRLFIEAVLWIVRTSSPWRNLPAEFGNRHTTYLCIHQGCRRKSDCGLRWIVFCIATLSDAKKGYIDALSILVSANSVQPTGIGSSGGGYRPHSTGGSENKLLITTFWSSHTGLPHTKEPLKKPERFKFLRLTGFQRKCIMSRLDPVPLR